MEQVSTILLPLTKLHKQHTLLSKFSLEAISVILQKGSLIRLEPDQVLYNEHDLDLKFYMILYGTFELMRRRKDVEAAPGDDYDVTPQPG